MASTSESEKEFGGQQLKNSRKNLTIFSNPLNISNIPNRLVNRIRTKLIASSSLYICGVFFSQVQPFVIIIFYEIPRAAQIPGFPCLSLLSLPLPGHFFISFSGCVQWPHSLAWGYYNKQPMISFYSFLMLHCFLSVCLLQKSYSLKISFPSYPPSIFLYKRFLQNRGKNTVCKSWVNGIFQLNVEQLYSCCLLFARLPHLSQSIFA